MDNSDELDRYSKFILYCFTLCIFYGRWEVRIWVYGDSNPNGRDLELFLSGMGQYSVVDPAYIISNYFCARCRVIVEFIFNLILHCVNALFYYDRRDERIPNLAAYNLCSLRIPIMLKD